MGSSCGLSGLCGALRGNNGGGVPRTARGASQEPPKNHRGAGHRELLVNGKQASTYTPAAPVDQWLYLLALTLFRAGSYSSYQQLPTVDQATRLPSRRCGP